MQKLATFIAFALALFFLVACDGSEHPDGKPVVRVK
jgi:hypothetical protein